MKIFFRQFKVTALTFLLLFSCSKGRDGDDKTPDERLYTIIIEAGQGGSISSSGGTYLEGTAISVTATPDSEYLFENWSGSINSTENPLNILLNSNQSIVANFVKKQYDLTITVEGEGTVEEVVINSGKEYASGTELELTAVPADGWMFSTWSEDLESTDNPVNIIIDETKAIKATFELLDSDGDGLIDEIDLCPDTPEGAVVDENGCQIPPIYLDENGVTIKARDFAKIGEKWEIDGVEYEVVDIEMLRSIIESEIETVGKKVTTFITDMKDLFRERSFNIDISNWDVSNVTNFDAIFYNTLFNQDIGYWDVSGATNMRAMFSATSFNQDISNWDVSNVTNMMNMFTSSPFNQDISSWNVSNVDNMWGMFDKSLFNQDISNWNVSNVTNMQHMFRDIESFNQDLSNWDVSKVVSMVGTFDGAQSFNQDISNWDVSNVTSMEYMFQGATAFNQNIMSWNVSNVRGMLSMFQEAQSFNQDISNWDVGNVLVMDRMFQGASDFNQDLSTWCVSNFEDKPLNFNTDSSMIPEYEPQWGTCPLEDDSDGDGIVDYFDNCPDSPADEIVDENGCSSPIYLDENGITIRARENAIIGETYTLNGVDYLVTDNDLIRQKIKEAYDLTKICTTYVTDMTDLLGIKSDTDKNSLQYQTYGLSYVTISTTGGIRYVDHYGSTFNENISSWDTSNVTSMKNMFINLEQFDQDLSYWDVSNVQDFSFMFAAMDNSGQLNLGNWQISNTKIIKLQGMFYTNEAFNEDLSLWETSTVNNMQYMFRSALSFNQDLSGWDTDNVINCEDFSAGAENWILPKPSFLSCQE